MSGASTGSRSGGADEWRGRDGARDGKASKGLYPPMAEISASATEKALKLSAQTIGRVVAEGRHHLTQAKTWLNSRGSPAAAWWEYIVAYELIVNLVPQHRDFYDKIKQSRSQLHHEFNDLLREVTANEERFLRIKDIIVNDNKRNGPKAISSQPSSRPSSITSDSTMRTEGPGSRSSRTSNGSFVPRRDDELMIPDVPLNVPNGRASTASPPDSPRQKPSVQPKPPSLHGRVVQHNTSVANGAGISDLAERFSKLRGVAAPIYTTSVNSNDDPSVKMPSPSEYQSSSRPLGPRGMPPPPPHAPPPHPPRLPLDTQLAASLPKEPSPTYSPARNFGQPGINPPRSTARSMVGSGGRSNSLASSASSYAPNTDRDPDSYFPAQPGAQHGPLTRRASVKPVELQITVEKLYDYMKMYNVLVIDVRDREEFDSGHIFTGSIMCIEPTALQDNISAEQLQDRLVLSPDDEQAMYERRNEYDLVIYYDESTKTNNFLQRHKRDDKETALKRLYDTLHEFNSEKPLLRPPIFLMGGIDAWVDLFGSQALKMSTTATVVANGQVKPIRAIRRAPAPSHNAKLNLHRRRRHEYNPMDADEERQWLEEARKGRAVVEHPGDGDYDDEESTSPMYRTTEDFLRRFPDVELDQQSMMYPTPQSRPTGQYVAPPPLPAPSRPAPSVPRVSYSGVHERQVAAQGRGTQPPTYVSPGRYGHIRLHKTGLVNFGVTCYMNSVVQCLSANSGLTEIFLSGKYAQNLQRENWKGTKGILPEAYATLLSNLYKGDVISVRPSTFRKVCGLYGSVWRIDEQQDAKEFLEFVLDNLHEDLNVTWNKPPLKSLTDAEEAIRENTPRQYAARIEWGRYQYRDLSSIGNLFAGQHASQLTCQTCGTTSTTYEAFWSISVQIPRDRPCDLRDCLRSYCSAERLDGADIWRCPRCKKDREAIKKITITRAPETLVVHFKRFTASRTESARKVRTPIHFPLQGLDLGPFMEPPISPEEEAFIMSNNRDAPAQLMGLKTDPAMNGPYIYNAYAVIWHIGASLGSGHYIALVKDKSRGCWRSYNDDRISDFEPGQLPPENRLQNEKAYIVFYEREKVASGAL
ncbi:hypothetical protein BDV95DRAFT_546337 [Massariosphaeria phaeospora]|uniref:Cysteine proteinase n=1 Tax=Massariosphaeria phaeospora TaxID=100035 RepID=A0A7C8I3X5_9PLEO|nr:hypothetical protein BDV95DRAFT_546337 [Massariosphaeria phaeospora]